MLKQVGGGGHISFPFVAFQKENLRRKLIVFVSPSFILFGLPLAPKIDSVDCTDRSVHFCQSAVSPTLYDGRLLYRVFSAPKSNPTPLEDIHLLGGKLM